MPVPGEEEPEEEPDTEGVMQDMIEDMMEASVEVRARGTSCAVCGRVETVYQYSLPLQVPLTNVRPRFVTAPRTFIGDATPAPLPLGRLTVAACPTGVLVARGWQDGVGGGGMSARRLSFLP